MCSIFTVYMLFMCVCCISIAFYESLLQLTKNNFLPLHVCIGPCHSFLSLAFAFLGLKNSYIYIFYHCPYNCCTLYAAKIPKLIYARKLLSANEVDFACLLWSYGCNRSLIIVFPKCQNLSAYQEQENSCAFKSPNILWLWGEWYMNFLYINKSSYGNIAHTILFWYVWHNLFFSCNQH